MTKRKERVTVTVDRDLVQAAQEAVASGSADSFSGWVNLALAERAARERKLRALAEAVAAYEAELGTLTAAELAAQERADRRSARIVRGRPASKPASKPRKRSRRRAA